MSGHLDIGPVMLDIEGRFLSSCEREKIGHPNTGAVILFARNYESPAQITALIKAIRACRDGELLIAVDQEGGRVQRLQNGFTRLPPAARYAEQPELAESAGWLMAMELLAVGVDFSFAPVLDVDCGVSEIIGDRSFSRNCQLAARYAGAFRNGMRRAGMAATGKHFPGHGAVALDSHLTLPVDNRNLDTLLNKDIYPFRQLIAEGLEAVMPAHVVYPAVDALPAGFSRIWIQKILRDQLKFTGAVFSDDLSMAGAAVGGDFPERAQLALQAGCDMVLVCNQPAASEQVLEQIPVRQDSQRSGRLGAMRGQARMDREQLFNAPQWQHISQQITQLNHRHAK